MQQNYSLWATVIEDFSVNFKSASGFNYVLPRGKVLFKRIASELLLVLLLTGLLTLTFNIKDVKSAWTGTVYIRADGRIDPPDAPIITYDNVTYTLTGNIISSADGIVVERNHIIIDGLGNTVVGGGKEFVTYSGVKLSSINNVTITNINIKEFYCGIWLAGSFSCKIYRNNITRNTFGILIWPGWLNAIVKNNVIGNALGIGLYPGAHNNSITENNIMLNFGGGIAIVESTNNTVYHNNFVNNNPNIYIEPSRPWKPPSINVWDDGYPSGGNYWSDYTGVDLYSGPYQNETGGDGIGDTPYIVDVNNRDNYPLMNPWGALPVVVVCINADGSISPPDAPILTTDNITYILTSNIYGCIFVRRNNIVIDGLGYTLTCMHALIGIDLSERRNVTIKNIEIKGYDNGIRLSKSSKNSILENNITNNKIGIYLDSSSNNTIAGNSIRANKDEGVYLWSSSYNCIYENNVASNKGGIRLGLSNYNNISRNDITQNMYGIEFYRASNNNVYGNHITLNRFEDGGAIPGGDGILLWFDSDNNFIARNNLTANSYAGIRCIGNNNIIFENDIENNSVGIFLSNSFRCSIYHNNFINNVMQVHITAGYTNIWDDGYPSGGNYWSDYAGVDLYSGPYQNETGSDGLGDTPYVINADNIDRYPLMAPFNTFEAGVWNGTAYNVDIVSNSTISHFKFDVDHKSVSFDVTGDDGTIGFSRVSIPKQLLWAEENEWNITINGEQVNYSVALDENNSYLYFTYHHSTKTITIKGTEVITLYTLNISTTPGGTTNPPPGAYTYVSGTTVSVTAIPNTGFSFDYWLFDGEKRTENPITVIMDSNHTLHAVFTQITYQLSITATAGGTTNPAPGIYTYVNGTQVIITAIPNNGFSFDYWLLDGVKTTQNPITIIMNANHALEAYFIDDIPPEIGDPWQDPPPDNVQPLQNVTVWVSVTDYGTGIKNVTLWYRVNNGLEWTILNMTEISQGTYQAIIQGYENCTWVTYKIVAYDNAGNSATKDNNGYCYQYHVIPEHPSTMALALIMLTTLFATALLKPKRKRQHP
jgi:parallel beta-helix repeat protein